MKATATIRTDRLTLRPLALTDLPLFIEMDTDPDVMRYIRDVMTKEQVTERFDDILSNVDNLFIGFWVIQPQASDTPDGWVMLKHLPTDAPNGTKVQQVNGGDIEVGYRLRQMSWGNGYATEAGKAALHEAFETLGLEKVIAVTDFDNMRSRNVLAKLGLNNTGPRKAYGQEVLGYEIVKSDWDTRRSKP